MKERTFLKSFLATLAVVLLVLGYSALTSRHGYDNSSLSLYVSIFAGKEFIRYVFTLIISVGYESALWLIYRNNNAGKLTLKIFIPSIALLAATFSAAAFLFFNTSWGYTTFILKLISILVRVCIAAIIMSCSLAILNKAKK
jgi:hypothetical protein